MGKYVPVIIGLILTVLALWLQVTRNEVVQHLVERLEHLTYDLQLRTSIVPKRFKNDIPIVIVDIDDNSLKMEGRWPWPRDKVAKLVDRMREENAAVIAFDILFAEKESNIAATVAEELKKRGLLKPIVGDVLKENEPLFNADKILADSLQKATTVLALTFLPRDHIENQLPQPLLSLTPQQQKELDLILESGYISNLPILQSAATASGFINIFPDEDGVIRRAPLLLKYKDVVYPSLALQTIMSFLNEKVSLYTPSYGESHELEGIKLGLNTIRTDQTGMVYVPYIGKSFTFPYYSATDVMRGTIPKDALLGKIIFVGTSATGSGDIKPTAIDIAFPGVEIQASLALGLLTNSFAYKPAWTYGEQIVLTLLFGLIASFVFHHVGPWLLSLIIVAFPPLMLFLHDTIWEKSGLVLSFFIPTLLVVAIALFNIIYGYLFETRRRERLKQMFGQYVPEKHIDAMIKTQSTFALGGEDREMSVLFADIRNFTAISENLTASQLVEMLNTYLTPMTEIIFKQQGTIDKYVGDLIMAFWGAPLKDENHAQNAMRSALLMQSRLKTLNQEKAAESWPELSIGIGINTGNMSVGDMGSKYRRNYTVLGDAVNLASRIESLTKYYGISIMVTEATRQASDHFVFRTVDRVRVKGKFAGSMLYELVAEKDNVTSEELEAIALYQQALDAYFAQQWDHAKQLMMYLHAQYPDKKLYKIYIDRITEFEKEPPPKDWNGIYTHVSK